MWIVKGGVNITKLANIQLKRTILGTERNVKFVFEITDQMQYITVNMEEIRVVRLVSQFSPKTKLPYFTAIPISSS